MSFFIQTNLYTPEEYVDVFYPKAADGALALGHTIAPVGTTTHPPIEPTYEYGLYRIYLFPLDPNDTTVFGFFTQFNGRRWWLMMAPTETLSPMRFWNGDFPPTGPHPTKFTITGPATGDYKYIFNQLYGRFICVTANDYSFAQTPNASSQFIFHWKTSCGPVVPCPTNQPVSLKATYMIVSRHGKAITASLTTPILSQSDLDFSAQNQRFFFRKQQTPIPAVPGMPFTYNMCLAEYPGSMLCFEQNGTIGTRTTAGPWEELYLKPSLESQPEFFGRFKIVSFSFEVRLRAHSNGSCSLVTMTDLETSDDYFSFIPIEQGVPYAV